MTVHQFKRKPLRVGSGEAYYGHKLKAHLLPAGRDPVAASIPRSTGGAHSDPAPLSPIARIDAWYQRNWVWCFAWTGVLATLLGVAYGIANR